GDNGSLPGRCPGPPTGRDAAQLRQARAAGRRSPWRRPARDARLAPGGPGPAADQLPPRPRLGLAAARAGADDGAVGLQRQRLRELRRLLLLREAPGDLPRRGRGGRPRAVTDPVRHAAGAQLGRGRARRGAAHPHLHPARHRARRQPELALPRLGGLLHPARGVRQAGHDRLGGRRAGPQAAAARPAEAPARALPAGLRPADPAGRLPGRRRHRRRHGRHRRRRAVDRRGAPAGAGRPGGRRRARGGRALRLQPQPDAPARGLPRPDRRPQRRQRPVPGGHVRHRLRRLVGRRAGGQPAEVGRPAGGAHRLHLRGARRGVRAVRQPRRPRALPGPGLRRGPDRHPLRRALRPLRRRRGHGVVHDPGPHQPGRRAAARADRGGPAAAGLLRRLGPAGQPAGRRRPAGLRPAGAGGPRPAGAAPRPAPPAGEHRRRLPGSPV
ncbi:MAG: Cell division protein FtsW, partial [uncultured Friedmanniella sp.]